MVTTKIVPGLGELPEAAWNALLGPDATPFVDWRWLHALEDSGCAAPATGWVPRHLTVWRDGELVAGAPAYVKDDSDGDFARDFDLAEAAERAGQPYYPKLVLGVPFTPVTGRRILAAPGEDVADAARRLVEAAVDLARREGCGTVQVLFPDADEAARLESAGFARRVSWQFHWRNEGYRTPEEFWARFSAKRRHMVRREMAAPARQGIALRTVRAEELGRDPGRWAREAHALHAATVEKLLWGRGWLNLGFYERIFRSMAERLEFVEARREGRLVAGAFNVASAGRLWGRYWGCLEEHPFLHFNVCYYHSIGECIRRGVERFEGGAGGEHKLARGFLPAETYSAHLFLDRRLDRAFRAHLAEETGARLDALRRWHAASPILRHPANPVAS